MRSLVPLAFTVLLLGGASCPAPAQQPDTEKLDKLLNSLAANNKLMGSVAIARAGQVVYNHGFGAAQVAPTQAATPATRYGMSDASSLFAKVMVFQLIEEKKLTLDTPLDTLVPQLAVAKGVSLKTLLGYAFPSFEYDPRQVLTQAQVLSLLTETRQRGFVERNTVATYGDSNTIVLELVVEKVTGQPYAQALQTRILSRAGLTSTGYVREAGRRSPVARAYEWRGTGWQPYPAEALRGPSGAGTLFSTPTDLNRFSEALFDGRLLSAASVATMLDERVFGHPAIGQLTSEGRRFYSYYGDGERYWSVAEYFPAEKLAITLCTNGLNYDREALVSSIIHAGLGQPFEVPDFPPPYVPAAADLARCVGTYMSVMPLRYTVTHEGNTLRFTSFREGSFTAEPISRNVFAWGEQRIEFDPVEQRFTLHSGRNSYPFITEEAMLREERALKARP
jgi:D-alanyl-D-alanine carboxypeptidase